MREIDPMETNRSESWELFKDAPMPMVTIFKTLDISPLTALKSRGYKLNMLLCWCIAGAADEMPEFKLLPGGQKMVEYDSLGVNVIVANAGGGITPCDIPFSAELEEFNRSYLELTQKVRESCRSYELGDSAIIGTSNLAKYEIDGAVNMYSGVFNNPFLVWGKYRSEGEKTGLQVSFQFHHVQMDGGEACLYLAKVQEKIDVLHK